MKNFNETLIEREFSDTLSILTDFNPNYKVLCAFSGGCDSLALLILLVRTLGKERVVPLYVNHNLRSKSELEEEIALNTKNCYELGLKLIIETISPGTIENEAKNYGGVESAARHNRYRLLQEAALEYGCKFIATAHHYDDQLETVLMKIISNGPITSLRGIAPVTGNVLRPLLEYRKSTLERYVNECGFKFSTDSTNSDNSIRRNELRNILIPELSEIMPDWHERIDRIRCHAVKECAGYYNFKEKIEIETLTKMSETQALMAIYSLWDNTIAEGAMPQTLFERVYSELDKPFAVISANGGTFCIYNGSLYLKDDSLDDIYANFSKTLERNFERIELLNGYVIERGKNANSKALRIDWNLFEGPVELRYVREGDVIKLKDGKKTVLKLLQDMKTVPVLRRRVPVIADSKEICAVFGSVIGGKDRICSKLRTSIAPFNLYSYICKKGK